MTLPVTRNKTGPKPRPIAERFMDKVIPEALSGCWLWDGAVSKCGYGRFGVGGHNGKLRPAHRVSWEIHNGTIPEGLEVAHRCDVRICVNPAHLWLATHAENMADMIAKCRYRPGPVFGDRNGSRTRPDRRPRGDQHWTRKGKK